MTHVVKDFSLLLQRLKTTLERFRSSKIDSFVCSLKELGEVGAFGGFVRDLARDQPRYFCSDIDLVVATNDEEKLNYLCRNYGANINRHGGFRLSIDNCELDVWSVQSTWAIANKIRQGAKLEDLLHTTYFTTDSIVWNLSKNKIHCNENYLNALQGGVVELELPENPYPLGILVRTYRLIAAGNLRIGPRLLTNTLCLAEQFTPSDVAAAEARGFKRRYLSPSLVASLESDMHKHASSCPLLPFSFTHQLPLPASTNKKLTQQTLQAISAQLPKDASGDILRCRTHTNKNRTPAVEQRHLFVPDTLNGHSHRD